MAKYSLREDILDAGLNLMFRSGYHGATVRDICAAAGAPHGSFTNHFVSKEIFTGEVLDRYFDNLKTYIQQALGDKSVRPRQRLQRYLEIITGVLEADEFHRGCLIGDLSLQAASESDALRQRLVAIFLEWRAPFSECIAEAQTAGEIDDSIEPIELADFLLSSWEGAILRMKLERGPAALERFQKIIFQTVFKELK